MEPNKPPRTSKVNVRWISNVFFVTFICLQVNSAYCNLFSEPINEAPLINYYIGAVRDFGLRDRRFALFNPLVSSLGEYDRESDDDLSGLLLGDQRGTDALEGQLGAQMNANDYNQQQQQQQQLVDYLNRDISNKDDSNILMGPVNDPADFSLSEGDAENSERPLRNSLERGVVQNKTKHDKIISSYLATIVDAMEKQKAANKQQAADEHRESMARPQMSSPSSFDHNGNDEYIDHPLALIGHQYVQGGAGEGRQLLGPDGTFENIQVIKSDRAVPSYCNPPNPCPIGYTAADGCLKEFVNLASFSREYQERQNCACDNEHSLYNCAAPIASIKQSKIGSSTKQQLNVPIVSDPKKQSDNEIDAKDNEDESDDDNEAEHLDGKSTDGKPQSSGKLGTLARTIQNRFGNLDSVRSLIAGAREDQQQQIQPEAFEPMW